MNFSEISIKRACSSLARVSAALVGPALSIIKPGWNFCGRRVYAGRSLPMHGRAWRPAARPCPQRSLRRAPRIRAFRTPAHAGISSRSIGGRSRRRRNGHEDLRLSRRGRRDLGRGGGDRALALARFSLGAPGPIRARSRRMRPRSGCVAERCQMESGVILLLTFQPHFAISLKVNGREDVRAGLLVRGA